MSSISTLGVNVPIQVILLSLLVIWVNVPFSVVISSLLLNPDTASEKTRDTVVVEPLDNEEFANANVTTVGNFVSTPNVAVVAETPVFPATSSVGVNVPVQLLLFSLVICDKTPFWTVISALLSNPETASENTKTTVAVSPLIKEVSSNTKEVTDTVNVSTLKLAVVAVIPPFPTISV